MEDKYYDENLLEIIIFLVKHECDFEYSHNTIYIHKISYSEDIDKIFEFIKKFKDVEYRISNGNLEIF